MAGPPRSHSSLTTDLHRLLEQYTPNGAGGRLLFALVSGSAAGFFLWASVVVFVVASGLSWAIGTALFATIALLSSLLTVVVLWPIYLAAIDQIESAADYGRPIANGSVDGHDRTDDTGTDTDTDDPIEVLKQRYATGELSEAEFEHRLDRLYEADERRPDRTDDQEFETVLDDLERN
ncbi:SHOCT domain-containing protein [Halobacteria archaeon AArc-m2/3/4]|uniref:SHOCT domain-containing protein n=1 Tax=Natronoglomus mannanivorans TaxID=2979990 RepID=A0AAP2YXJ8_9EURY|nr:SHOCT domain-containing protein [Halobacteria archaeon AArc-xg1-1]MCU4973412.1 SHOCT domain-containing protein [Halobacteria archaeon AArc-m2/3/4]